MKSTPRAHRFPGAGICRTLALLLGIAASSCQATVAQDRQPASAVPEVVTLDQAVQKAQANEALFAAVSAQNKVAALDRSIARAALLPSVVWHNQVLYTQPNGEFTSAGPGVPAQAAPRFIANNAVREYTSQAVVNELIGLRQFADVRAADASSALAAAELEVARRGLVATVVGLYYGALASDSRLAVAKRAADESNDFTSLTQKREAAREAAHADVVKAQLQQQQRQRDLADAAVTAEKMHLELATLLFPDPRTPYSLQLPAAPGALAAFSDVEAAAARNNPELKSALASVKANDAAVLAARAAYLPDLGLNVTYGVDAAQLAAKGPDGVRNLGYSASVTVDLPIWDWLATGHKVKQSEIRRDAARVALTAAQRQAIAHLQEFYSEVKVALAQLQSLDESARTAAESLRLTRLRYSSGEATVLEVVDAENSLTLAENARTDGMTRYQLALASLQTLTGDL